MRRFLVQLSAFGLLFAALYATPVQAQATRTWVSGVGDDANPCSRTAPCKTFAGAITKTAPSGEINVLDPGGFGAVTITKSITISSIGFEAGVLVSGTNGIVVSVGATDKVVLDGLDIEGLGSGLTGVLVNGGGNVTIRNSSIRNFTQNAVSATGTARVVIDNVFMTGNGTGTTGGGVNVGAGNGVTLMNCLVDHNVAYAVQVTAGATATLIGNTLANSTVSLSYLGGGGGIVSYGNNVIKNGGTPTSTVGFQ